MAPRFSPTPALARKLVAYLMAVPRGQTHFPVLDREACQVLPLKPTGRESASSRCPVDQFRDWQENTNSILLGSPA